MIKNRFSLTDSKKVIEFYIKVLDMFRWQSFFLVITGFSLRGLSILIFVLILRIFLSIIEPQSGLDSINEIMLDSFSTTIDEHTMVNGMLIGLATLVSLQFLIGKINLYQTLDLRNKVLRHSLKNKLSDHRDTHLHIAIDYIPPGLDAIVKSAEIVLFYTVLLICIFYFSILMGFAVLLAVPAVLGLLIIKGRKEVFDTQEFREVRKKFQASDNDEDLNQMIELSNKSFSYPFRDMMNSHLSGNAAIILIMIVFLSYYEDFQYHGTAALLLVFSIRYSLIYAGELSRLLNRVLKQRTIVEKIESNPFSN